MQKEPSPQGIKPAPHIFLALSIRHGQDFSFLDNLWATLYSMAREFLRGGSMRGCLVGMVLLSFLVPAFALDKVLYLAPPQPETTTTNYPQQEATGYFIHEILTYSLAALSEWAVVTELPTNRQAMLLYRLETTYAFSGPIQKPVCLYSFRLYNDRNALILHTNTIADIRYGIFDAVDVAVFSTGKALGEDLSQYTFLTLIIPDIGDETYGLYLNKTKILDLTNTIPLSQHYRLATGKPTLISVREKPSLHNLWLGRTLWQTNITLLQGDTPSFPIPLVSVVTIAPLKTELLFFPQGSYTLSLRFTNSDQAFTNLILSSQKESTLALPLGKTVFLDLQYTPKGISVAKDTLVLKKTSLSYQPVDTYQTRPFYVACDIGTYVSSPETWKYQTFPFIRLGITLFYYPSMNQRIGVGFAPQVMVFPQDFPFVPEEQSLSSLFVTWGWYPFNKKYQTFRFCLEFTAGWQKGNFLITEREPQNPIPPEVKEQVSHIFNAMTTGAIFEASPSLEIGLVSLGVSLWVAPRNHPLAGNLTLSGIGFFLKTIL
ncbi:MAG: hypothetical protein N2314_04675 [Brevinematales bacterium]|nr:hypothetical protein [Brevinematales bacterium]